MPPETTLGEVEGGTWENEVRQCQLSHPRTHVSQAYGAGAPRLVVERVWADAPPCDTQGLGDGKGSTRAWRVLWAQVRCCAAEARPN